MTTSSLGLSIESSVLEQRVRSRLADIEGELARSVESDVDFINEAARHLLAAGGKRFRPLLVVLAAEFGDGQAAGVIPSALVVELTHLATLYHDDVMDQADLRRGAPSANARWDNCVAILTGDFLFARASAIVADLGPDCVRIQAKTFARLVQGQIRETVGPVDWAESSTVTSRRNGSVRSNPAFGSGSLSARRARIVTTRSASPASRGLRAVRAAAFRRGAGRTPWGRSRVMEAS